MYGRHGEKSQCNCHSEEPVRCERLTGSLTVAIGSVNRSQNLRMKKYKMQRVSEVDCDNGRSTILQTTIQSNLFQLSFMSVVIIN